MASRGYLDIGAVQRQEGGGGTVLKGYLDIGAVQREEAGGSAISAAGASTTSAAGASLATVPLSAAGASAATLTSAALASVPITATGESTATFGGAYTGGDDIGALIAMGESAALFGGASTAGADLLAEGESEAEFAAPEEDEIDVTLWGRLRHDARLRARIEAEDAELIRIVRTTIAPELLRRRTLH